MSVIGAVVEGDTARQTFTLYEDGTAFNGAGFSVDEVFLTTLDGIPVATAGKVGWENSSLGQVYLDPEAADFKAKLGPYRIRVRVTDGGGKKRSFPNDGTAEIQVRALRQ